MSSSPFSGGITGPERTTDNACGVLASSQSTDERLPSASMSAPIPAHLARAR
jgi:hypothetical protein